ncbi:pyridoxamine 5'-phosphate oxidase family protein [Candidatus Bathyarchaeota archaeon]|nr:pyridoxamine 5'-phosphate oxidase family protein [Candidatus Bathyarchaeota archaeon]
MSPYKLPWMSEKEINELLDNQLMSRIAFIGDDYPYLIPFRYIRLDDSLYFHFTDYGKKMRLLNKDNRVCVQIESYAPDLSSYNFVSLRGSLEKVEAEKEKKRAVDKFYETGKEGISINFLAAHGFDPSEGWDAFKREDLVIMKLVDIVERVGLKGPD